MSTPDLAKLFSEAMSFGAIWGSVMPTDTWDAVREAKAAEYVEKASGVTAAHMDGMDSMFGLSGDMA